MLARTLRMPRSNFRYIPNPTNYRWDRRTFSLLNLLTGFRDELGSRVRTAATDRLFARVNRVLEVHHVEQDPAPPSSCHCCECLDELSTALQEADDLLSREPDLVVNIVARHFDAVLADLNTDSVLTELISNLRPPEREARFMRYYFRRVRPIVVGLFEDGVELSPELEEGNIATAPVAASGDRSEVSMEKPPSATDQRDIIWCTLVFRMLCWLQLHEFGRKDVMIPKSELLGSRLEAYIF